MARSKRNASAPDPAVSTADQDVDTAISPAPQTEQPSRPTAAKAKEKLIKKSLDKDVYVTIQRVGAVNGRTHTGRLVEVEPASGEGENATEAVYAVRTGQPGRPVKLSPSEIHTITEAQVPLVAEDDDNS